MGKHLDEPGRTHVGDSVQHPGGVLSSRLSELLGSSRDIVEDLLGARASVEVLRVRVRVKVRIRIRIRVRDRVRVRVKVRIRIRVRVEGWG